MAQESISKIDKIDNIVEMADIMKRLRISGRGLETIHQMKAKVKESQRNATFLPGQGFSVVAEAKDEDVLKRRELLKFYKDIEVLIKNCDEKVRQYLEKYFSVKDIKEKIKGRIERLEVKEYIFLVSGDTSSGKSSFINLLLDEDILPSLTVPTTPTICELRYGEERKLITYYKDDQRHVILRDPAEGKSYPEQLKDYLNKNEDRDDGAHLKKFQLFWPHNLLKNGVVVVESPGVGEASTIDKIVEDYLLKAFGFIYVVNSCNAGEVQKDQRVNLLETVKKQAHGCFPCECAVFVCNMWDLIESRAKSDDEAVKQHIFERLKKTWPNLNSQSQIVHISITNATESQKIDTISPEFVATINAIKTMMLRTNGARLEADWSWLQCVLSRMIFYIKVATYERQNKSPNKEFDEALKVLPKIKEELQPAIEKLNKDLQFKIENAAKTLFGYLSSELFIKRFTSWSEDECPEPKYFWENTKEIFDDIIQKRFEEEIERWEAENHVIEDVRESIMDQLTKERNRFESRIQLVEKYLLEHGSPVGNESTLSIGGAIAFRLMAALLSPFNLSAIAAIPLAIMSSPINFFRGVIAKILYTDTSKSKFMAKNAWKYLENIYEDTNIIQTIVKQSLQEVRSEMKRLENRILVIIDVNMSILKEGSINEKFALDDYLRSLSDCLDIKRNLSYFAIKKVLPRDINLEDEKWSEASILGSGAFANVYKGSFKTCTNQSSKPAAVKVWINSLSKENACEMLQEELMFRKLDHKNVVKFYGATLRPFGVREKLIFVMELCGETLRSFLSYHPESIPAKTLENTHQTVVHAMVEKAKDIAMGLEYLHGQGVIHRDLKPENILVGLDNCWKIGDVGLSKNISEITNTVAGTRLYMAPEIHMKEINYDARADIYSFGLILWEMWYGIVVFKDKLVHASPEELVKLIVYDHIRPKLKIAGLLPLNRGYRLLMEKCWSPDKADRPNADVCVADLNKILEQTML